MLVAVLSSLFAAQPSLALPGLDGVGLQPGEAQLFSELLAQKLAEQGCKVVTARDIGAALGAERQKELLGCGDASCIAELAGALGSDGIVLGDIGKLDATYAVNLKIIGGNGKSLALFNATAPNVAAVPGVIATGAAALARQLDPKAAAAAPSAASRFTTAQVAAVGPLAAGVLGLLGFIASEIVASVKYDAIRTSDTEPHAALYRDQGANWQSAGNILLTVGLILVAASVVLYVTGGAEDL